VPPEYKTYSFKNIFHVVFEVHKEHHLPAGVTADRVDLFALWVVREVIVTSMQGLFCIHRV
jgi:hypothetical protein